MAKIYTKKGDKGTTSLLSGKRVPKFHIRVEAYGNIDELTSFVGLLRSMDLNENIKNELVAIQQVLFNISGLLSCDEGKFFKILKPVTNEDIDFLENSIDKMTEKIGKIKHFILPGGRVDVSYAHICRVVARRAERRIVELADKEKIDDKIIVYVNRLSDYFFTLSRFIAAENNFSQIKVN